MPNDVAVADAVGTEGPARLHTNENPYGASPAARAAAARAVAEMHRYPESAHVELTEALAAHLDVPADRIVVGNGADELVLLISLAYRGTNRPALTSRNTFQGHASSLRACGVPVVELPLVGHRVDAAGFAARMAAGAGLAFVCNPHNPTGTLLAAEEVETLCASASRHGAILVLDEAYAEYAGLEFTSGMPHAAGGTGVCCVRTFSKIHGLAGLRIGYLVGDPELVRGLNDLRRAIPFHVNRVAYAAALAALEDPGHVERSADLNRLARAELVSGLTMLGLELIESHTNFVLVSLPGRAGQVARRLEAAGSRVRHTEDLGLPDWLRVTVGSGQQTARFLATLERILQDV